jgi:hypothetical protein
MSTNSEIFTRDRDAAREFAHQIQVGMVGINVPIPVPMVFHSFVEGLTLWRTSHAWSGKCSFLYAMENDHLPLADGHSDPRRLRYVDDEVLVCGPRQEDEAPLSSSEAFRRVLARRWPYSLANPHARPS